jgi:hypothetical protein
MVSRFLVDSHKRPPATSTTPPEKRRTSPIIKIEQRSATDQKTPEKASWCGCARFRTFAVMLADQVTARQIERVDHMERDDERYPTTVEGSVRLIDSY